MLVFSQQARKRFEDQMVVHIKKNTKQIDSLTEAQLRERVIDLIISAESHQIDEEENVKQYIDLFFDLPSDVFNDSEVKAILQTNDLSSSTKIAFLNDTLDSGGGT